MPLKSDREKCLRRFLSCSCFATAAALSPPTSSSRTSDDAHMASKTPALPLSPLHFPLCPSPLRLQSATGNQQTPISTATVSMVHSVPELMVSSEVSLQNGETRKTLLREYCTLQGQLQRMGGGSTKCSFLAPKSVYAF